jgi:hypothetical protein
MLDFASNTLIWILAIAIASFVFWRRTVKEFSEDQIWRMIFKTIFWSLISGRFVWWLWQIPAHLGKLSWLPQIIDHPGMDIVGVAIGIVLVIRTDKQLRQKKPGELYDGIIEAYLWAWLTISGLGSINWFNTRWQVSILILIVVINWYLIKKFYRVWTWYPSGKVGFLWWSGIFLISLQQLTELLLFPPQYKHIYILKILYFAISLVISIIETYKLSGRDKREDSQNLRHALRVKFVFLKQKLRKQNRK